MEVSNLERGDYLICVNRIHAPQNPYTQPVMDKDGNALLFERTFIEVGEVVVYIGSMPDSSLILIQTELDNQIVCDPKDFDIYPTHQRARL